MSTDSAADKHRLPSNVIPTHYDLTIATDLETLRFYGSTVVHLDVVADTSSLVFHSGAKLALHDAVIISSGQTYAPNATDYDKESERTMLTLPSSLPVGSKAVLKIGFEADLSGSMTGYYRSAWKKDGKTVHYALTQFEATSARTAFPCWDEPALKATFSVTLISRDETINLGNSVSISEEPFTQNTALAVPWLQEKLSAITQEQKWKVTKFEQTPRMSTYIVAYANGVFEYIEDSYVSPLSGKTKPLRIYATSDVIGQAQFALDVKKKVLPIYEQIFDIEYPLPKLDTLFAHDFDAGAMENWGLITGRTAIFSADPANASIREKRMVANVMSHEVAHMWFGNITTMQWWDNLYLNEGFASLMGELVIIDKAFPEWKAQSRFISTHLSRALGLDANPSSHPIEVPCPDANMVNQIFDGLSYSKAASVLRMLLKYVGDDKFLHGVSLYLKDHLFGNSVTEDLWKGIATATGVDVPKVMDNWVKKIGFPVVTVTETDEGITVKQNRFLQTGAAEPQDDETIWTIPLALLAVSDDGKATINNDVVLDSREKFIPLNTKNIYKINAGTTGVYRALYPKDTLAKIAREAVRPGSALSLEDRMGLVTDAANLAKAGLTDTSSALTLVDLFRNETEFVVWTSINDTVEDISSVWSEHTKIQELLSEFNRNLYAPLVQRLGSSSVPGESVDDRELRVSAITHAANAADAEIIQHLQTLFKQFLETGDVDAEMERITLKIAVKHGGRAEFEAVKGVASNPKKPSLGQSALIALGATQDEALITEIFDYLKDVRDQDLIYVFLGLTGNYKFRRTTLKKFLEVYDALYKRLDGNWAIQSIIRIVGSSLSSREAHDEIQAFFKDKDTSKFHMALNQGLASILAKASWIERSTDDILQWFEAKKAQ